MRHSGRDFEEMREVVLERGCSPQAEGSCLVRFGRTEVLCVASVETRVPLWLRGRGKGWVTAEYAMLPRATAERRAREGGSRVSGRSHEIRRLIGRTMRSVVDMGALGERQVVIDCDVLRADGGTRTAAITGSWVALCESMAWLRNEGMVKEDPLRGHVAAVACGIHEGEVILDPDYEEDARLTADVNFAMTDRGEVVEIQASSEGRSFGWADFDRMVSMSRRGIADLIAKQAASVCDVWKGKGKDEEFDRGTAAGGGES